MILNDFHSNSKRHKKKPNSQMTNHFSQQQQQQQQQVCTSKLNRYQSNGQLVENTQSSQSQTSTEFSKHLNDKSATYISNLRPQKCSTKSDEKKKSNNRKNSKYSSSKSKQSSKSRTNSRSLQSPKRELKTLASSSTTSDTLTSSSPTMTSNTTNETNRTQSTAISDENQMTDKNSDIRARYWAYLFDNLKRSVDEIYQTCEYDENINECKEVILILQNCTNDFRSLINRIQLMKEYEKANFSNNRPNSLAWELRKSSPRKSSISALNSYRKNEIDSILIENSKKKLNELDSIQQKLSDFHLKKTEHYDKYNNLSENSTNGFQDFLPASSTSCKKPKNKWNTIYNDEFDDDYAYDDYDDDAYACDMDDDNEHEDEDDEEADLSNYQDDDQYSNYKNKIDPIDLLNHETFNNYPSSITQTSWMNQIVNNNDNLINQSSNSNKKNLLNHMFQHSTQSTQSHHQQQPSSNLDPFDLPFNAQTSSAHISKLANLQYSSLTKLDTQLNNPLLFVNPNELSPFNLNSNNFNNQQQFFYKPSQFKTSLNDLTSKSLFPFDTMSFGLQNIYSSQPDPLRSYINTNIMFDKCYSKNLTDLKESLNILNVGTNSQNKHLHGLDEEEFVSNEFLKTLSINNNNNNNNELWTKTLTNSTINENNTNNNLKKKLSSYLNTNTNEKHMVSNTDIFNQNMLKFYEEDERNMKYEIKQDKRLLSVLEEEVKLAEQLSIEQLIHFNQEYQNIKNDFILQDMNDETDDLTSSKLSTDLDTYNETERDSPAVTHVCSTDKNNNNSNRSNNNNNERGYSLTKEAMELLINDAEQLESSRTPGRALQVHEKLSLLNRKSSPNERRRRHEEKHAKAQERREQMYKNRLNRLKELAKRIREANELKNKIIRAKRATIKAKLERAEERRDYLLRLKATKAAVEEQKAHEIAFINSLSAQNRKNAILEKHERKHEAIKQNLEEERTRKQEEQKAKEHAAELRRKELETQRTAKLKEMLEKRKIKQTKIEQTQMEKEKERIQMARAKEKNREIRLANMEAQYQANRQQVRNRIQQKQEEWCRRHESNLEEIRKKAFEMSILRFSSEDHQGEAPTPVPYENVKYCNACNVIINSEVKLKSHLRGLKHQQTMNEMNQGKNLTKSEIEEYNLSCIIDVPKEKNDKELMISEERTKMLKKRVKKLKNKIFTKGIEYEASRKTSNGNNSKHSSEQTNETIMTVNPQANNSQTKSKLYKLIKDLEKILKTNEKLNSIDRICVEINRILVQKNANDQQNLFKSQDAFGICIKLIELIIQSNANELSNSLKTSSNLVNIITIASRNDFDSCSDLVLSNKLYSLIEILNLHSNVMLYDVTSIENNLKTNHRYSSEWFICTSIIQLIESTFTTLNIEKLRNESNNANLIQRAHDLISLMTSFGLIDTLSVFFSKIRGPLDDEPQLADILQKCLHFLISITKFLSEKKTIDIFSEKKSDDTTQLIATLKITNLVNIISMLYGMLHKDASTPVKYNQLTSTNNNVKKQTTTTLELTNLSIKLINQMIKLDLNMVQNMLGEESLSHQLRHICCYLIWYLSSNKYEDLLHEIILLIGYFTVLNDDNQIKIELGTSPTILQQLCNLPFNYFSDKRLTSILYPTLVCFCYKSEKNKSVLTSELSTNTLANFINEKLLDEEQNVTKQQKTTVSARNNLIDEKFELSKRFPSKLWKEAVNYFSS